MKLSRVSWLVALLACVLLVQGAYSIDVGFSVESGGESASLESSYDVDTSVSVSEESEASFDQPAIQNTRSVSGTGDIKAAQTYSGSCGYSGSASFTSSGEGSLTGSASLSPVSMNALQSVSVAGTGEVGMMLTNAGTANVNCNLVSGSMQAEQRISTGSAHGSQNVVGSGTLGASISGTDNSLSALQEANVNGGVLSTSQDVVINGAIVSNQVTQIEGGIGGIYGYALGQENYMAVAGNGNIQGLLEANLQSVAADGGSIEGSVSNGGYECISDAALNGVSLGTIHGSTASYPYGQSFESLIQNSKIELGTSSIPEDSFYGLLGIKWYDANPNLPFSIDVESIPEYLKPNDVLREATAAENVWDAATTRQLFGQISWLFNVDPEDPEDPPLHLPGMNDGINVIGWQDLGTITTTNKPDIKPLGITEWWAGTPDGGMKPNGGSGIIDPNQELLELYEADITLSSNTAFGWRTDDSNLNNYDVQTVLLHELGHALGLKDLYVEGETETYSTSSVTYDRIYPKQFENLVDNQVMHGVAPESSQVKHSLGDGDIAGIRFLYPDLTSNTWNVNPGELIQDYINKAMSSDTITISPGIFNENLVINKPITLQGAGKGLDGTIIDGQDSGSVIRVVNEKGIPDSTIEVNLFDLLIRNGLNYQGGGIYNLDNLNIEDCTITENDANVGGGIFSAGTVAIKDSDINLNNALKDGDGYVGNGGGIFNDMGQLTIRGSTTISKNTAENNGGGVYNGYGGILTVEDSAIISDNYANSIENYRGGGGIFNEGLVTMHSGTISANNAGSGGGVMNEGTFTMNGGTISKNNATKTDYIGEGGGGVLNNGVFTLNGGVISKNNATGIGGGIYSTGSLMVNDGTISENRAINGVGGGVFTSGSFIMNGGTISKNSAGFSGGSGVALWGGTFTMNGGTISGNNAANGGGIYAGSTEATFIMNGGTISRNNATSGNGGGIRSIGNIVINGGTISGNNAKLNGGGISQMYSGSRLSIQGTGQIIDNKAITGYGGGIYSESNSVTFDGTESAVKSNKAKLPSPSELNWYQGWGVYLKDGMPTVTNDFNHETQVTGNLRLVSLPEWEWMEV